MVTIPRGCPVQVMEPGSMSGDRELFMVRVRIHMYVAVVSFGLGSSLDWTSITKAEPTAENRWAWYHPESVLLRPTRRPRITSAETPTLLYASLFCEGSSSMWTLRSSLAW